MLYMDVNNKVDIIQSRFYVKLSQSRLSEFGDKFLKREQ